MAASEALLPFDKGSGASTSNDEVSSARQRRRRSTKKPGIGKSSSIVLKEGTKSLELNTLSLDSTQSPRKWYNMKTDLIQGMEPNDTTDGSNQVSRKCYSQPLIASDGMHMQYNQSSQNLLVAVEDRDILAQRRNPG